MLETITIKGYKSIQNLDKFKISNLNVLIGANGSGKSNFISAFQFINALYNKTFQFYTINKGSLNFLYFDKKAIDKLYVECQFTTNTNYKVEIAKTNENKLIIKKEEICFNGTNYYLSENTYESNIANACDYLNIKDVTNSLSEIKTWKLYHFHDTSDTAKMKGMCASNDNLILKENADNLAAYLKRLNKDYKKHYDFIVTTIQMIAPFFGGFIFRDDEYIQVEWFDKKDRDTSFKAHMLSDGTLRFICLTTLLLQPFELMPNVVIIDEVELGLHPSALKLLSEIIKRASEKIQVIISTQSIELLNQFDVNDIIVVNKDNSKSTFSRLNEKDLEHYLKDYSIGDMLNYNIIGNRP